MSDKARSIAVVTGGNRGLGRETCHQLTRRGWRVALTSRDPHRGRAVAEKLRAADLDVVDHQLDVTDPDSVAAFAEDASERYGRIDALVNNAGIALDGFNTQVATRTLEANFFGAMRVTDALIPLIAEHGRIVMVSSGMGELACVSHSLRRRFLDPELTRDGLIELMRSFIRDVEAGRHTASGWPSSAYRVSKAGLNALTRLLAAELRDTHIHVNSVCPGWVRTDMGGSSATRNVEEGAATIVWAATLPPDGPTGGFFRDRQPIAW